MKKDYIAPSVAVLKLDARCELLVLSGVTTDPASPVNIDYGGVDNGGELTPGAREFDSEFLKFLL